MTQTTTQTKALLMPIPENCSDLYAAGWAYADHHISAGGSLNAESPGGWNEERVNGFWDRLAVERKAVGEQKPQATGG
ncbi:hypothetical protein [Pseudomonas amygdali]|uniref:hypothetical protein n=1 Tax=Pseudomonas amygdali TaxID=47877 RepID=UPI000B2C02F6|nr:hypothetical protein [Pseudomonas amygdali]